jgi:hypothetical protein
MQNKLVIALLLSSTVSAQLKVMKSPDIPAGASSIPQTPELSKDVKKMISPGNIADMPIPPAKPTPSVKMSKDTREPKSEKAAKKQKKEEDTAEATKKVGAAAKLLPETMKEDAKDEKSSTPLLADNDARCYAARFSDLKGAAALTHYATVGVN